MYRVNGLELIYSYLWQFMNVLGKSLNVHKRLVREEAVKPSHIAVVCTTYYLILRN
jgi:hypothetical protein